MPSKCFRWRTLSHYSPVEQHQVPSPKNNHHHKKKPVCRKHINSLGDKWTTTLLHTQNPLNTTLHSWQNGVPIVIILGYFGRKAPETREFFPFLYANTIKRRVYWKNARKRADEFLLQSPLRAVSRANACFVLHVRHHTDVHGIKLACLRHFSSSHFVSLARIFVFHRGVSHKKKKKKKLYYHGDGHHLASSPCQVDLYSPGGTLCHGRLSCMCIQYYLMSTNCLQTHLR